VCLQKSEKTGVMGIVQEVFPIPSHHYSIKTRTKQSPFFACLSTDWIERGNSGWPMGIAGERPKPDVLGFVLVGFGFPSIGWFGFLFCVEAGGIRILIGSAGPEKQKDMGNSVRIRASQSQPPHSVFC
jgi:hypothetical protein